MEHYEEVLKILHDKFDWKLTDSLTTTGKKLVADTIKALKIAENNQALQLQQTGVMRCSSKYIDKFYNDTMYTDQTNYYGVIQRTKKGDYVRWKQPSQMIKDFMRWKKNNA